MPEESNLKETPPLPAAGGSYRWDSIKNAWVLVERTEQSGPVSRVPPPTTEQED